MQNQLDTHDTVHTNIDSVMQEPTSSGRLDGRWKLLYTTRPGTASPIQRSFIGVDSFTVYQDIDLSPKGKARVNNVVIFGKDGSIGQLKVRVPAPAVEGFCCWKAKISGKKLHLRFKEINDAFSKNTVIVQNLNYQ